MVNETIKASLGVSDSDGFNEGLVTTGWFLGDEDSDNSLVGKTLLSNYIDRWHDYFAI